MAKIEFAPEVRSDFVRIMNHLAEYEGSNSDVRVEEIFSAIDVLQSSLYLGRLRGDLRELIIGKKARGYVVLYDYN